MELTGNKYAGGGWRKVLATRRGTVLVATVCAVVAAAIIIIAMNSYRHNVNAENSPETVFVASGLIQKGTSGEAIASDQLFKPTSIATKQVSTGAIADAAQLHGKVATANIYPGQQLTASDFTASGGLPSELGPSQRAMTVTVDSAHGMVGQINNGDHVDVYADLESGNGKAQQFVRLLLTDVPVLKTPSSANNGAFGNNPSTQQSNVTLKVDSGQAGALAFASDNGKVWLVLRPANAAPSPSGSTVSVQSLASGGSTAAPAGSGR